MAKDTQPTKANCGFIVHSVSTDPEWSYGKILAKSGALRPLMAMVPPYVCHNYLMPLFPVSKLRQGCATGVRGNATQADTSCVFWGVPYDPNQIMRRQEHRVRKIAEAGLHCAEEGASLIGLGAYTSIVGHHGLDVARILNGHGIGVTTGNTFTGISAVLAALQAAREIGRDPKECTAAIIGAGGSTGRVAAMRLRDEVRQMYLVGRNGSDLSALCKGLGRGAKQADSMEEAISNSEIIITVTSDTEPLAIEPKWFKRGAVVADVARPRDISRKVAEARPDVFVFDGPIIRIPGDRVSIDFDFGFPAGTTYACMAETLILAARRWKGNFSLGKQLDYDQALQIEQWAAEDGFVLDGFRRDDKPVSESELTIVAEFATARR